MMHSHHYQDSIHGQLAGYLQWAESFFIILVIQNEFMSPFWKCGLVYLIHSV